MSKAKQGQEGFGLLPVLLVVGMVGVLTAVGWIVYQRNKTQSSSAAPTTSQPVTQAPAPTPPAPTVTYLEIKEWGVKLPLPAAVKDAYYVVPVGTSDNADGLPSS